MPPRRRRKNTPLGDTEDSGTSQAVIAESRKQNTTGFAIFPVEILLIILSYIPGIPVPCNDQGDILSAEHLYRSQALLSLSQTCRWLRHTFHPLVWDSFEACASPNLKTSVAPVYDRKLSQELATDLVRKAEIVTIRDPTRANFVRVVTVSLTDFCARTVFAEFARCLECFPHLETVQILSVPRPQPNGLDHLQIAFSSRVFPTVQNLLVPCSAAITLFRCFPAVRTLWLREKPYEYQFKYLVSRISLDGMQNVSSLQVQMLYNFNDPSGMVSCLVDALPNIRTFPLDFCLYSKDGRDRNDSTLLRFDKHAEKLSKLKHLTTINFLASHPEDHRSSSSGEWPAVNRRCIELAEKLVRGTMPQIGSDRETHGNGEESQGVEAELWQRRVKVAYTAKEFEPVWFLAVKKKSQVSSMQDASMVP